MADVASTDPQVCPVSGPFALNVIAPPTGLAAWQREALAQLSASGLGTINRVRRAEGSSAPHPAQALLDFERVIYRRKTPRLSALNDVLFGKPNETCDLVVDFAGAATDASDTARLGVLRLLFDNRLDPLDLVAAVRDQRPISIEARLTREGHETVLSAAIHGVQDTRLFSATLEPLLGRATQVLERAIAKLAKGDTGLLATALTAPPRTMAIDVARFASNGARQLLADRIGQTAGLRAKYFIASFPLRDALETELANLSANREIQVTSAPRGFFYADPFPFHHDGVDHLFFETFDYSTRTGRIDVARVAPDGSLSDVQTALQCPYHLSYPFVFEHDGDMFMLPETSQANRIELHRAIEYPTRWQYHCTLIDNVRAADTTLLHRDGLYWLFATLAPNGTSSWDELYAFYATNLFGPWKPHAEAPLKSDARSARPAGHFIQDRARLLRPAQDCGGGYGRALVLNEVEELTPTGFREREIARFGPGWMRGNQVFHTLNVTTERVWIDGKARAIRR